MHRALTGLSAGLLACALLLAVAGCDLLRGYAGGTSERYAIHREDAASVVEDGAALFVFGDFGGLNTDTLRTNAVPWKVVATALVVARWPGEPPTRARLGEVLGGFGFIEPRRVANWPMAAQPGFSAPLGIVTGYITRSLPSIELEVANLGCAACHAGVTYDARGQPVAEVWLGLPNTSIDLDSYVDTIVRSLKTVADDRESLLRSLVVLFPETSERELQTIEQFVWPTLVDRLAVEPLPFANGGPGRSNGVGALRLQLGLPPVASASEAGVSIPELGNRELREALLVDGLYRHRDSTVRRGPGALADIVAFFTVPTMGLKPERAMDAIPAVDRTMTFVAGYKPPPFPGYIDTALAQDGARVYAGRCAQCHGAYRETDGRLELVALPAAMSAAGDLGTDATRATAVDADMLAAIGRTVMARYVAAEATGKYAAPPLSGIWATAPYLHNGSVPTLWHLMRPDQRPQRFWSGGHALDLVRLGIAGEVDRDGTLKYPPGYDPWSTPRLYDTRGPGRSNRGHEREFEALDDRQKDELLEFLKRL